jgi:hypothetical protein
VPHNALNASFQSYRASFDKYWSFGEKQVLAYIAYACGTGGERSVSHQYLQKEKDDAERLRLSVVLIPTGHPFIFLNVTTATFRGIGPVPPVLTIVNSKPPSECGAANAMAVS